MSTPNQSYNSKGVSEDIRKELAMDIESLGGIEDFDIGKPQVISQILSNPKKQHIYSNCDSKDKKQIRNLVNIQWKRWPKQRYLDKVFFPLVLGQTKETLIYMTQRFIRLRNYLKKYTALSRRRQAFTTSPIPMS